MQSGTEGFGSESLNADQVSHISEQELRQVRVERSLGYAAGGTLVHFNAQDALQIAVEDIWSSLFCDNFDTMTDDSLDSQILRDETNTLEDAKRVMHSRQGGLREWDYGSLFEQFSIDIDGINKMLGRRFIRETNSILDKVTKKIQQ
eukprot:TRINITY_DN48454_c0_g1_i1.p1 TRINITY_DN48454_c0_g1~~TRINITY_DN48454_c0_g1_i1.p1  ORF type:complete len:147 (+),score=21.75 TRINITY_DN48454_c0_g1_i1:225-665(+)